MTSYVLLRNERDTGMIYRLFMCLSVQCFLFRILILFYPKDSPVGKGLSPLCYR